MADKRRLMSLVNGDDCLTMDDLDDGRHLKLTVSRKELGGIPMHLDVLSVRAIHGILTEWLERVEIMVLIDETTEQVMKIRRNEDGEYVVPPGNWILPAQPPGVMVMTSGASVSGGGARTTKIETAP